MTSPTTQTIVLTTNAPGVAWFALVTAGIEASRAALVTRPGAAIDSGDVSLARELCAALALTGANQLVVIGYAEDTVYKLGARGLANLTRNSGGDLERFSVGGESVLPGLRGDAAATVQRTVHKLAQAAWLPPGMVVMGVVVSRSGISDNVALEVVGGGGEAAPAEPERAPAPPAEDLEPHPLLSVEPTAAAAPWPANGGDLTPADPVGATAPPQEVPRPDPLAGGDSSSLGEIAESGPMPLGSSALGAVLLDGSALDGSSQLTGASGALESGGALSNEPLPAPAAQPGAGGVSMLAQWFAEDHGSTLAEMDSPPVDTETGDVDARLAAAATLLHQFLRDREFQPPIDDDIRNLLREGASPEAIMRPLKILVTQFSGGHAEVRAAFGTLEMAQALLTREDLTAVLRRILR